MFSLILNITLAILSAVNVTMHKKMYDKVFWSIVSLYAVVMSITKIAAML